MNRSLIPQEIIAGNTLNIEMFLPLYPANDGWELTLHFQGKDSFDVQSTQLDNKHLIRITAAATHTWALGTYCWIIKVSRADESYILDSGKLHIIKPCQRDNLPLTSEHVLETDLVQEAKLSREPSLQHSHVVDLCNVKNIHTAQLRTTHNFNRVQTHALSTA